LINSDTERNNLKAIVWHWVRVITSDTTQSLLVIRGITESFMTVEGIASLESSHGPTTGEGLF